MYMVSYQSVQHACWMALWLVIFLSAPVVAEETTNKPSEARDEASEDEDGIEFPLANPSSDEPERDSWYIGFGLGRGYGAMVFPSETVRLTESGPSGRSNFILFFNFKIGATLRDDLLLGFDMTTLNHTVSFRDLGVDSQENYLWLALNAVVTWFPWDKGLFLRGGVGICNAERSITVDEEIVQEDSAEGIGLLAGTGFALWLGKSFNISINADVHVHNYFSIADQPEWGRYLDIYLGFDWF